MVTTAPLLPPFLSSSFLPPSIVRNYHGTQRQCLIFVIRNFSFASLHSHFSYRSPTTSPQKIKIIIKKMQKYKSNFNKRNFCSSCRPQWSIRRMSNLHLFVPRPFASWGVPTKFLAMLSSEFYRTQIPNKASLLLYARLSLKQIQLIIKFRECKEVYGI